MQIARFTGRVIMITGASVGIGHACAIRFAQQGAAALVLLDWNAETLRSLENEMRGYPATEVMACTCDVGDEVQVNAYAAEALVRFGRIDVLVNNAGIWRCWQSFLDTPTSEWERYIRVNIMGTVNCTRAVLGDMVKRGYGRIINVASVAGVYGNANMTHYSATKGALIAMTKALAKEVAEKGVTVNSVSPGSVSPSEKNDIDYTQPSELAFMGRTGSCAENADLICFLASDEASYISAQNIQIDGCRRKQ